jgi:hypothetical protein
MSDPIAYKCVCSEPQIGIIDADQDAIFCALCAGWLGYSDDIIINND